MIKKTDSAQFQDLVTHIYDQVKQMIRDKTLPPGVKIKQEHLARELGVSRTPLIKALQTLTSERLLEYVPRHGFYVKVITLDELLEIFSLRQVVEGVVAKSTAEKATGEQIVQLKAYFEMFSINENWDDKRLSAYLQADQKFHAKMIEINGSGLLKKMVDMFHIYTFAYQKGLLRHPKETIYEHMEIITAIERRDAKAAQEWAMLHIENTRKHIAEIIDKNGSAIKGVIEL